MEEPMTCGMGLAEHAALPQKLGALTDSVGDILELHMEALDLTDEHARTEHAAYAELVKRHHKVATELMAIGERMRSYRDLPMGKHDERAFADPRHFAAFERFVRHEQELLELLRLRLVEDRKMLSGMSDEGVA